MLTGLNTQLRDIVLTRSMLLVGIMTFTAPVLAEKCLTDDTACRIPVTFTGNYLEDTCDISINDGSFSGTVTLPVISTARLQQDADEAGSRPFKITLNSCPINRTVELHFVSAGIPVDSDTGNLTNSTGDGFSRAVQVRLRNIEGMQMLLDSTSSFQEYVIPENSNGITHYFNASYYAKGVRTVTPGLVQSRAGIELIYK